MIDFFSFHGTSRTSHTLKTQPFQLLQLEQHQQISIVNTAFKEPQVCKTMNLQNLQSTKALKEF